VLERLRPWGQRGARVDWLAGRHARRAGVAASPAWTALRRAVEAGLADETRMELREAAGLLTGRGSPDPRLGLDQAFALRLFWRLRCERGDRVDATAGGPRRAAAPPAHGRAFAELPDPTAPLVEILRARLPTPLVHAEGVALRMCWR
jgi:hypothetical protein